MNFEAAHKFKVIFKKHQTDANLNTQQPICICGWKGTEVGDYHNSASSQVEGAI